jgi:hypothetical protein
VRNWFNNLEKWQKGALIGSAVGLIIVCLAAYAWQESGLIGYIIQLFALLLHYWLAWPFSWLWNHGYTSHIVSLALLGAILVIFYGGLGALFGRIQQITSRARKMRLTGLLTICLIVFYASSFLVGGSQASF